MAGVVIKTTSSIAREFNKAHAIGGRVEDTTKSRNPLPVFVSFITERNDSKGVSRCGAMEISRSTRSIREGFIPRGVQVDYVELDEAFT
jgi:hypothetical protein